MAARTGIDQQDAVGIGFAFTNPPLFMLVMQNGAVLVQRDNTRVGQLIIGVAASVEISHMDLIFIAAHQEHVECSLVPCQGRGIRFCQPGNLIR